MPNKTIKKTYNHTFSLAFSLESKHKNPEDAPKADILEAMQARVDYLRGRPEHAPSAVKSAYGAYEVDPKFAKKPEPKEVKYIIEAAPTERTLGLSSWDDVSKYLKRDPRPAYRLVSAAVINNVSKIIWELK